MSQDIDNSQQQLFSEVVAKNQSEITTNSQEKAKDQTKAKDKRKDHWLFAVREGAPPKEKQKKSLVQNVEEVTEAFNELAKNIREHQESISNVHGVGTIHTDFGTLGTDDVKTLFKDDCPQFKTFFSDDFFRTNIEVLKPKMTEVDLSSWLQPQQQQGSRLRLQRKAKTKEKRYAQLISDDDDDDFEEVTSSKKRKKTENKNYNINNKAIVQHEDGCMSIDIITDDDEDENQQTNTKSKDDQNSIGSTLTEKIKNVVKRPMQTITDIWNKKSDTNNNGQSHNDGEGSQNSIQSNYSPTKSKKETEDKVECPMCAKKFPTKDVMDHAFYCDGVKETRSTRSSSNGNASTGDYQNWVGACHSLNEKPGSSSGASNSKIPVELPEFSGKKKKKPSENSFRGPKQQFAEPTPQHPYTTNTSNVFTKLKDDEPKERNPTLDEGFGDSQEDIIAGYTTVRPRKPNRTYGRGGRRKNYFDHENSQGDGGTIKCARCSLSVPEERYKEHTDNCLNQSTLS